MRIDKKVKIPLFFLFSYIILVPSINGFMKVLEKCFKTDLNTVDINLLNLFTVIFRNGIIFVIWSVLNLVIILVIKSVKTTKQNAKIEVEGVNLRKKDGTFGTADWATREEIKEFLSIGKRDGIIIGETDKKEIITLPMDTYLNKNIAVFGSSGSKKSRGFAIPNGIELAQEELQSAINRNMSLVFTDPKRRII
jgi:type IV secretion system protein VirD4